MISSYLDSILHIDQYLKELAQEYAVLTYAIIFIIIFCETGLIITPFLPGDSLLFAAGALAATGALQVELLFFTIFSAAVLGDAVNYTLGKFLGPQIFKKEHSIFFHKEYLARAQSFYEKHGKKTIILARFIPIIRTFAPFVAGIGVMPYRVFFTYNIIGALIWSVLFIFGGYFFGNIPVVQNNLSVIILVIILLSFVPALQGIYNHFKRKEKKSCSYNGRIA